MKKSIRHLAEALVDASRATANEEIGGLCDAAIELFRRMHPGASLRLLLRSVKKAEHQRGDAVSARLLLPGKPSSAAQTLIADLEKITGKLLHCSIEQDADIRGGLILFVDDTRIDASVQGALRRLRGSLVSGSSTLSSSL